MNQLSLRITEIFYSLQGETSTTGLPTVFVRLTGCPLRCHYCDTEYAFYGGEKRSFEDILAEVDSYGARYITVTGGEPLAQPNCIPLLEALCDKGYIVSLETSGAMPVDKVDPRVVKILDLKTPASGEVGRNRYENIPLLLPHDEVKFVICDRNDYEWTRMKIDELGLLDKAKEVLLSPSQGQLSPTELADWIIEDRLPVRFQTQLHKLLWKDEPGH